jgi:hypothetical protein
MAFAELEVPSGTPDLPSFDPLDDPSDTKLRFIAGDSEVISEMSEEDEDPLLRRHTYNSCKPLLQAFPSLYQ